MANISKNNIFPTISKVHIKDTFNLYNNLVKNAMKYQSAMVALAAAVNDLSHSYDDFLSYPPMRVIIESSNQQNEIHNSLKIYRILYESFKKMGEFLNRDFALPLNDDFKSMQVKFNDKKIEKTLKMEEKQRTKSLIPGVVPEPSHIQRGLFQQYISAIKFVTRKTRKLQNYEIHVLERLTQGMLAYEDKNANIYNSFSMSRDNYEEPTPRLNYVSGSNKKSIFDVSQFDNATFDENILNHDNNPLTNSFIKEELKKSEMNDSKYYHYSSVNNDAKNDKILRESIYDKNDFLNDDFDKEMESNVNNNKGYSSDYSKRDIYHHRYTTSTPNIYEMKYTPSKHEENETAKENQYRNRSKSLGSATNAFDRYKQNHFSMPASSKNTRYSVSANTNGNDKKDSESYMNNRYSTIKSHSSSTSSGKSAHSQHYNSRSNETQNEVNDNEPENNDEANTTITEVTAKKDSKSVKLSKKSSIKNDLKRNLSEMKNILHKRRSTNTPPVKPVSILKNKNASKDSNENGTPTIDKNDNISKLQDIMNQEDGSNDDEEFIVISKKKMDNLIRTGKVHSIDDILKKNKHSSVGSSVSENTMGEKTKDMVESPTTIKNNHQLNETNHGNVPNAFASETPDLANENTPILVPSQPALDDVSKPLNNRSRTGSFDGNSHIRGMPGNLASNRFPSIVPNGYATPMLSHQEPTMSQSRFNKTVPIEYATPMLSHFHNNTAYSPMLTNDVPSYKDDITPPSRRGKSTYSIQNLLNNWPNFDELTQAKENHPIFNQRKNSLPIYDRKTPLAAPPITASPITTDRPTLKITSPSPEDTTQKKKGVNWDDNNKEYLIPNSAVSAKSNEESYYDDIINATYATENEESSMMINDPTRLIFSRFNTSASNVSGMTEESTLQTPTIQTPTPMDSLVVPPNKNDIKRLNGLKNIITRDVLEDELPPTPISPTLADNTRLNGATSFEPENPVRGESLHYNPRRHEESKKDQQQEKKEEEEEELLTPIEKVEDNEIDENEIVYDDENDHEDGDESEDSEDDVKLAEIPRFNKTILKLKVKNSGYFEKDLASPCPTPTTYMMNKMKEIEDKNKEKSDDELNYNSEEDLDILRFISYRRAPEKLEKHLMENEQQQQQEEGGKEGEKEDENKINDYTTTATTANNPEDPFNYNDESATAQNEQTEEIELSDIESEIIDTNVELELEIPKKMDRKDSVKSVISNISSKFSQKLNSMFSSSESTAINNTEKEGTSDANKNIEKIDEVSVITEETTMDEEAIKENIEEQKEELTKTKDVFDLARKLSSDFIKGSGELIRRSSKESLKSLSRKFSVQSEPQKDPFEKPDEMESMMQKSNSIKIEEGLKRRNSSASLTTRKENTSIISDDRSAKTTITSSGSVKTTITSASLPRKDSLIRAASIKKQTSVRSVGTVGTNGSNLTSTPILNPAFENDTDINEENEIDETPTIDKFPEKPERPVPRRPSTPNAPNTPVFPNIKLCNILMNHEEPTPFDLNEKDDNKDIIVISNPFIGLTNNKYLADYKDKLPNEYREFRISKNEAYMTFEICQNSVDIESAMGSIIDPDEDSSRMEMLNNESSLSFRSINPSSVYEEKDSVILAAPKYKGKGKKPDLEIDTLAANTSNVVAIIPSPVPQKDNNFVERFNNLNAASLIQETREQQQQQQQQEKQPSQSSDSKKANATFNNNSSLKKYVALYPYNARDGRELSFQRADVINVRREQGEWVYGYIENMMDNQEIKYGWVPKSYLKIITIF